MDPLLTEVTKASKRLEQAEAKYIEAMTARNVAIRVARADRRGPGEIGKAADLTPEQVRRIVDAPSATPGSGTKPPRRARKD